jgi:FkbM family methyltransferase
MDEVFKALGIEWPDWPQNDDENIFLIKTAEKYSKDLQYRDVLLARMPAKSKEFIIEVIEKRPIINAKNEWERFALSCLAEELKIQTFGEKQLKSKEIFQNASLSAMQNLAAMAYFARKSYLTLSINCLVKMLSDYNVDTNQKHYSILHLVNSFNPEWHLKEAQKEESLADGIIRFFEKCACIKNTDIEEENIQSTIESFCKISAQIEEFDDWIHIPLHATLTNIKDGNINEAVKAIQHKLSSVGIAKEESAVLARSCTSKLAMRIGSWDEASKLLKESKTILNEYKKNESLKNSILPIVHTEVELLSHELSIALANKSLESQGIKNGNLRQDYNSLSRSQLGQDLWVLKKLDWIRNGYFVEFGATDGVLLNNSWLLEKYFGWNGICAEPNPRFLKNLKINRQCDISDKCVFSTTNQIVEFVCADVYGGIKNFGNDDSHKDKRDAYANNGQTIEVETISLVDLLKEHNAPLEIDYLSIDTEGSEFEILNAFDWESYSIKCITVEHNYTPMRKQIRELLTSKDYACEEAKFDDWYFKK